MISSLNGPPQLTLLVGDGEGGFSALDSANLGDHLFASPTLSAAEMASGDFDGDGVIDLVVAGVGPSGPVLLIVMRDSQGMLQPPIVLDQPFARPQVAVGDISGDGRPDIVVSGFVPASEPDGTHIVGVLWNDGGAFKPIETFPAPVAGVRRVVVHDVDGDGLADVALSGESGEVAFLRSVGDGFAEPERIFIGDAAPTLTVADFNGDQRSSIAAIAVFGSDTGGVPSQPQRSAVVLLDPIGAAPIPGDVTGDGVVNGLDIKAILAAWGLCRDGAPCPADLNGDGVVDGVDLAIVLANWGS